MKKKMNWKIWGAAACLCLVLTGGVLYNAFKSVGFNAMIANYYNTTFHNASLYGTNIDIGGKQAWYHEVSIRSEKLEKYIGEPYQSADSRAWYIPAGITNLKYLILQDSEDNYSLWEFSSFIVDKGASYTYGDVMKTIYGVNSAEDIVRITTTPSTNSNTALHRSIQKEIGTRIYTDRESIEIFYQIAENVVCYGVGSESKGDPNRFSYSFFTDERDKPTSEESTYGTRFIKITLADGTTIDSWKYDALSGSFFEYGSIFTQPLSDEDVYKLNDIFDIK
ncbi:MAG: hypothetical protein HDR17_05350 [Lachnospiraceae bacterium]|nr:hypothetical protein [Lachnospiraceae bacterium]